jgi:integrase
LLTIYTFATTVTLSNGVPIESVSKMLGHKNLKSTQVYARVLDIKVSADMEVLRNKLQEIMNSEDGKVLLSYTG